MAFWHTECGHTLRDAGRTMTLLPRSYTLDASVIMNAFNPADVGHAISLQLQTIIQAQAIPVVVPTLLLVEIAATISRVLNESMRARTFARQVRRLSYLQFVSLTQAQALAAVDVAADRKLRGADAIYVAVSLRSGTTLVTLDVEQRNRVTGFISVQSPTEALADLIRPTPSSSP